MKAILTSILFILLPNLVYAAEATAAQLAATRNALTTAKLLPTVLDSFAPRGLLQVSTLDVKNITIGQAVQKSAVAKQPTFSFTPSANGSALISETSKMILIMVDPDVSSNTSSQIRHMLAANIEFASLTSANSSFQLKNATAAASSYASPSPPAGAAPHRSTWGAQVGPYVAEKWSSMSIVY
ncbi:hypothetical protein RQP46_002830 [Phenoliferia psychrophenolica]